MYAQVTHLQAPMGRMNQLRTLIEKEYLSDVRERDGFISAQLLEQVDDHDAAILIIIWDNQAVVEDARRTGLLKQTVENLAAELPGLRVQRNAYLVRLDLHADAGSAS